MLAVMLVAVMQFMFPHELCISLNVSSCPAADRPTQAEASTQPDEAAAATLPAVAGSGWQPLDASNAAAEPAPVHSEREPDQQDSPQLQSWNDELTQRLDAAMQKLPKLLPKRDGTRTRPDRRRSAVT